jgi:signal transduction histidine kinase
VVLAGMGGVLWFMREAMQNERFAVRQRLSDAYRGHLTLTRDRVLERWKQHVARLDEGEPSAGWFAVCVEQGLADSAVCLDARGKPVYPTRISGIVNPDASPTFEKARKLVAEGRVEEAIENLRSIAIGGGGGEAGDSQTAKAALFALELMGGPAHPKFAGTAGHLARQLGTYAGSGISSPQRRFLSRELMRISPASVDDRLLAAEDLAAAFLEATPRLAVAPVVRPTEIPDVWQCGSPGGEVLALFTGQGLEDRLGALMSEYGGGPGIQVAAQPPGNPVPDGPKLLISIPLGETFPGWRLTLSLMDEAVLRAAADRRTTAYLWTGLLAVVAMALLAVWIARTYGRQVQLAQLKNDLVATVSHELKTPLTSMRVLVDTLLESERLEETTTREYLHLLAQENARLSRLINNVLTFSRLERNKQKFESAVIAPGDVVEGALAAMRERCEQPGCELETEIGANLPWVRGDLDALVTALRNVLDNAWKYTGEEKRIGLRASANNGHVEFAVSDNGCGIPARETRRIFERFYRVDQRVARTTEGCGLGLSIVREIVAAHAGTVDVRSEPGRGSTFTIKLPALS